MKSICLLTCLLIHLEVTSAGNKDRYNNTGPQEYPDVLLLLDENDVLDEMLDQAWLEVNGNAEEEKIEKTGEIESSGKSAASGRIAEQSGEQELEDRTQVSGETVLGSAEHEVSGDDQKHHQAQRPVQQMDSGCGCEDQTCECCLDVDVSHNIADVCVQVTLLREEMGLKFAVTWKGQTAFSKSISAENPPSICFSIPFVRFLKGCIRFTNMSYDHTFGGCISLGFKLLLFKKEFKLGCFYNPNATSLGASQDKHDIGASSKPKYSIKRRKTILEQARIIAEQNDKHKPKALG
ncbi:uncharacterized protein LOC116307174 [Actinia tenebrosa]|uniref:Uncharacterized protein LOC116307174 n=1 Tax=Actinia tenebrosa TaxID=6105 RepID=A0A6P8J121_ACTTE|nr:uncharacterized protein LOC116307174 [Actinia tenebrosa]